MRWVHFTTAPDQLVAEMWRDLLKAEGVSAQVRAGDTSSFLGVSTYPCRIMREHQVELATGVFRSQLGRDPE